MQWIAVDTEIHNPSKYREQVTVKFSALNGTSIYIPHPSSQDLENILEKEAERLYRPEVGKGSAEAEPSGHDRANVLMNS